MTKNEFIERTAAGLRNMNLAPDYLVIFSERFDVDNWEYDEETLCGIPIIKSYAPVNYGYSGYDYPVIPCFKNLREDKIPIEVDNFQRGFSDKFGHF